MESEILKFAWRIRKMENNYQLSRIHNYVHGLMSRDEMHALEREALEDPFLQDAIDGYKLQQGVDAKQLSILQQRLATRVKEQANDKNRRFYSWQRLAIGMAAGVMFIIVCTLLLMKYLPQQRTATLTEVEIMTDQTFSISILNYDREKPPVGGWKHLESQLNEKIASDVEMDSYVEVEINNIYIKEGDPNNRVDVKFSNNKGFYVRNLEEIFKSKTWQFRGKESFVIKAERVNIK
jgi:hypothetical protein